MATNVSKKRKFVADGVFYAELNEVEYNNLYRLFCTLVPVMHPAISPSTFPSTDS